MLHLFKKVYVTSDSTINLNVNRVVISKERGTQLLENLDKVANGVLLAYGKSMTDLYSNKDINDFVGLISFLNNYQNVSSKPIIIYLDDNSFMQFTSTWFKTIFKQIDCDYAWKIIDSFIQKNDKYQGWKNNTTFMTDKSFVDVDKQLFDVIFSEAVDYSNHSIFADIKKDLSLEYLIASYLVDNEQIVDLANSLKNIMIRTLHENMLEVKFVIYKNQNKKIFNYDIDINLFTNSTLFKSEVLGCVGLTSNIDLLGASQSDIDNYITLAKQIYVDWEGFSEGSAVFKLLELFNYVRKDLNKEDIDFILNFEKTQKSNDRIYCTTDEEKINAYLLDKIFYDETFLLEKLVLK